MNDEQTKQIIASMLVENTGIHMLDSGGDSGRAWQRNQGRNFESEKPATVDFSYNYIDVTLSVYHWLIERLDYDQTTDELFHAWATSRDNEDKSWFGCVDEFIEHLKETWIDENAQEIYPSVTGLYGDGDPMTINTYNGEDLLSQIIQYTYFEIEDSNILEDGIYIFLSIHGGCDARGGYTAHRVFSPNEMHGEEAILFNADASIYCNECGTSWYTDGGYTFSSDDSDVVDLSDHTRTVIDDLSSKPDAKQTAKATAILNKTLSHPKLVVHNSDAYCPICGEGVLLAG